MCTKCDNCECKKDKQELKLSDMDKVTIRTLYQAVGGLKDGNLFSQHHHEEYQTHLMHIEQAINEIRKLDPTIGY